MTEATFHQDLVSALGALSNVHKAGKVNAGQRRYSYLELPDLLDHVRTVFAAHRLAVTQDVQGTEGGILVTTTILHVSGDSRTSQPLYLRCSADPQSVGSATTYGRRYGLSAMVGLAGADDDDGQHAQQRPQEPRRGPAAQREEYGQTRPVQRHQQTADEPDQWAQPRPEVDAHTVEVAGRTEPPADPITPGELGDGVSRTRAASDKSIKMMWALLRRTGMTDAQTKLWVGTVLNLGDLDWHTSDLTQAQVSAIIQRLQGESDG